MKDAVTATGQGRQAIEAQLLLRVACLYPVSRLCSTNMPLRWKEFETQKAAYTLVTSSWTEHVCEVLVPRTHRNEHDGYGILVYIRLPTTIFRQPQSLTVIFLTEPGQCRFVDLARDPVQRLGLCGRREAWRR